VLFLALIALVAMTIAALALIRAVDTANVISGNFAFKQSTLQMAEIGIERAVTDLPTITSTSLDAAWSSAGACTTACQYYPTMAATTDSKGKPLTADANGVVYTIDWNAVPTVTSPLSGYEIRYVIDRLCQGPAPVTDLVGKCLSDTPISGGTKKSGGIVFSATNTVYYRATVRVTGPRNTESYVQAILSR
jgi:Tfp pilus assembly protein PilX